MDKRTLDSMEKELLAKVLAKTNFNLDKTARLLQISLSQLRRKMKKHGLTKP